MRARLEALQPGNTPRSPDVRVERVAVMQMALACRTDDPLAGALAVDYRELAGREFVDFPLGWGNRTIIDGLFAAAGVERSVSIEVVDVSSALDMVQGRLGLAFVPQEAIGMRGGLAAVDLALPPDPVTVELGIARLRPAAEATRALLDALLGWSMRGGRR